MSVGQFKSTFTEDEIAIQGEKMFILFGLSPNQQHPPIHNRPKNYKQMLIRATIDNYFLFPDIVPISVVKFPPRSEEDLGYAVTSENSEVLLGWLKRTLIVNRHFCNHIRKKQINSESLVDIHCYMVQRLKEVESGLVVKNGPMKTENILLINVNFDDSDSNNDNQDSDKRHSDNNNDDGDDNNDGNNNGDDNDDNNDNDDDDNNDDDDDDEYDDNEDDISEVYDNHKKKGEEDSHNKDEDEANSISSKGKDECQEVNILLSLLRCLFISNNNSK